MNYIDNEDTIAAIATPVGIGGIAIIRISGSDAINIVKKIFITEYDIDKFDSWKVHYGKIIDVDKVIDEVLVTIFRKPFSYTKEDVVEINCHGGVYVSKRILENIIKHGARLAEPGEFTKRAFLNGRIDLSQAEAVADLIQAKTEVSLHVSLQQMSGYLTKKIEQIRSELIDSCSLLEIELDFSEEDIKFVERDKFIVKLNQILLELTDLINSYDRGKIIREGVKLVIVGKPNVGKSSLLNALLKEDRAIVTHIPGTTRDSLEEQLDINGILFRVVDTAGIIETEDIVEKQGIIRTQQQIETADLIIHVFDGSEKINGEDLKITQQLKNYMEPKRNKIIAVINKIDLETKIDINDLYYKKKNIPIVKTSAKELIGIVDLERILSQNVFNNIDKNEDNSQAVVITKVRHLNALKRAKNSIEKALVTAKDNLSSEFITVDLREALDGLGEITGTVTSGDILNNIFEKFCIGK